MSKRPTEHQEQAALFKWAKAWEGKHPELRLLHASLNGVRLHLGSRLKAKAAGMKAGVPDMFLPVPIKAHFKPYPSNEYGCIPIPDQHGLFIELKRRLGPRGGKLNDTTPEQEQWLNDLSDLGYRAEVAYGWEMAANLIADYLGIDEIRV